MIVWGIIAGALVLRLYLALSYQGFWGVDGGAYLESVNTVLGHPPDSPGFPRPPLAPGWLLVPFTATLGFDIGYKVWSALASLAPVLPVYLFARRLEGVKGVSSRWIAPFAVGFLCLDLFHAEMLVTGALPLLAFGLLGTAWWAMGSLVDRSRIETCLSQPHESRPLFDASLHLHHPRREGGVSRFLQNLAHRDAIILALCIGLIPWINQTTAGLAVITLPVYLAGLVWYNRDVRPLVRITPPALVGGVIALAALPWYMQVLPGSGQLDYPGPVMYLTRAADPAWVQLGLAWFVGLLVIWKGQEPWLRALGILCCLFGTLSVFLSYDETVINLFFRSRYLLAIPFFVGITWAVFRFAIPGLARWGPPAFPVIMALIAAALFFTGYIMQVHGQSRLSSMISPDTAVILEELRRDHPGEGIIANSFTLSLWISALTEAPTFTTWNAEPPAFFTEDDQDVRCLLGWVPGCDPVEAQKNLGARWILIEGKFPWYNGELTGVPGVYGSLNYEDPWANLHNVPWLELTYEQGTTTVWRILVPAPKNAERHRTLRTVPTQ